MRRILVILFISSPLFLCGQITTPVVKARFGVDGDLRANFFNGLTQTGNDDWFNLIAADTSGKAVIDTTGASSMVAGYLADISPYPKRMATFFRTMNRPSFSIVNNRLWLDALFVRDYHGTDSTVFTAGGDKNGMSPAFWSGGVQGIPDKNDILDIMMHIRRAGPSSTDSLWMLGGISLDNTTGNRYFDFEMYQTDIYYDRVSQKWYGFGPDEGHTSWEFDAAGNVTKPGDVIFSAEFQSSTLTNIEARIWVNRTVWSSITPIPFTWSGLFDGSSAGSAYGYASIQPRSVGAFYTGLASAVNTWPGPFRLILQNNTVTNAYAKDQYIEFSVNLSKLGLDPVTSTGGDICGTPFNRVVIKTRSSASFTSELKDFVAPTDFFLAPRVDITTITPQICDTGSIANIYVTNPVATSVYVWSTPNGHILPPATGPSIFVDTPGVYIVKQYLQAGCSVYATDTIIIASVLGCYLLQTRFGELQGQRTERETRLSWQIFENTAVRTLQVEKSTDGIHFSSIAVLHADTAAEVGEYHYNDPLLAAESSVIYYRILAYTGSGRIIRSTVLKTISSVKGMLLQVFPTLTNGMIKIQTNAVTKGLLVIDIYDNGGRKIVNRSMQVEPGYQLITLDELIDRPNGVYLVKLGRDLENRVQKIVLSR